MKLKLVASGCQLILCPAIYETDRDTYIVQGKVILAEDKTHLEVPDGENVVEIPRSLLEQIHTKS